MNRTVCRWAVCSAMTLGGLLVTGAAWAEDPRVEIGASAGWTLSDGVTFDGVHAGDGNVYNSIEPKDSFSYNLNLGFFATPQVEVGFLFGQQKSTLQVGGTTTRDVGDQSVDNYHGYFAYNFGDSGAKVRPYLLGGAGATHYGSVPYTVGSVSGETAGTTKFSTTWGAGVKIYPGPKVGLKLGVAGRRPTSNRMPPAGGATPTGAATWSATPSTRTSSSSREASFFVSEPHRLPGRVTREAFHPRPR